MHVHNSPQNTGISLVLVSHCVVTHFIHSDAAFITSCILKNMFVRLFFVFCCRVQDRQQICFWAFWKTSSGKVDSVFFPVLTQESLFSAVHPAVAAPFLQGVFLFFQSRGKGFPQLTCASHLDSIRETWITLKLSFITRSVDKSLCLMLLK